MEEDLLFRVYKRYQHLYADELILEPHHVPVNVMLREHLRLQRKLMKFISSSEDPELKRLGCSIIWYARKSSTYFCAVPSLAKKVEAENAKAYRFVQRVEAALPPLPPQPLCLPGLEILGLPF